MAELISYFLMIGSGIILTIEVFLGSIITGLIFGTLLAILRFNKIAVILINQIISILRGTPLILQLSFIYFLTPAILGFKLNILTAGIITFGLNSSAYIAEILRAGIESLPKGQFEAAQTLQIPKFFMWKDIIFPQVIKNILPALISEAIALLKETALISTIGGMDIMRSAQSLAAEKFTYFMPLCIAACYYYLLVLLIETLGKKIKLRGLYA